MSSAIKQRQDIIFNRLRDDPALIDKGLLLVAGGATKLASLRQSLEDANGLTGLSTAFLSTAEALRALPFDSPSSINAACSVLSVKVSHRTPADSLLLVSDFTFLQPHCHCRTALRTQRHRL
jgi:hypothetical protein